MHEPSDYIRDAIENLNAAIESLGHMPWVFWSTLLNIGLLILLWKTFWRARDAEHRADAESAEVRRLCNRS